MIYYSILYYNIIINHTFTSYELELAPEEASAAVQRTSHQSGRRPGADCIPIGDPNPM